MFIPIDTPRLLLRRFHSSDVQAFLAYRNDPIVARYQSWDSMTPGEADELVFSQSTLEPGTRGMWFQFAVQLKSDGQLVGDCGLLVDSHAPALGEIGFTFSTGHQGRGLATEATAAVLQLAFDTLHLRSVKAVVDCRNEAAVRLLERLGLRREGRQPAWFKGAWCDEYVYVIAASEW